MGSTFEDSCCRRVKDSACICICVSGYECVVLDLQSVFVLSRLASGSLNARLGCICVRTWMLVSRLVFVASGLVL